MPRHLDLEIFAAFDELALFVSREIDEDTCRNGNRAECHDDDFRIAAHVVAEPGRRRELDPMGHLVQADPEAKVAGGHAECAFYRHNVGRHQ